jgi:hypothetical protein
MNYLQELILILAIVAVVVIAGFWKELARPGTVKKPTSASKRSNGRDAA